MPRFSKKFMENRGVFVSELHLPIINGRRPILLTYLLRNLSPNSMNNLRDMSLMHLGS